MDSLVAALNHWVLGLLYIIPFAFLCLGWALHSEIKRVDKRIDATLSLLRQRGIDLLGHDD